MLLPMRIPQGCDQSPLQPDPSDCHCCVLAFYFFLSLVFLLVAVFTCYSRSKHHSESIRYYPPLTFSYLRCLPREAPPLLERCQYAQHGECTKGTEREQYQP